VQAPQFEGVENITFPTFVMGVPITNMTQINDTYYLSDGLSRVIGAHTLKVGGQFHIDQVNDYPNGTFNGTFNINGTETGDPFADLLLGVASNFTQSSGSPLYLRNRYEGVYGQDSWRARNDLTINAGLRWDVIMPFWEKYNQIQTWIPGAVVHALSRSAPRIGGRRRSRNSQDARAHQLQELRAKNRLRLCAKVRSWILEALFGGDGKSSIRASYGIFYTEFPGLAAGVMYGVPPFGYNYLSPAPPLLATPFITAATGSTTGSGSRFPFRRTMFPRPTRTHPSTGPTLRRWLRTRSSTTAIERLTSTTTCSRSSGNHCKRLLTMSYVGNQGHRILAVVAANLGNAALCQSLAGCSQFGEDNNYTSASGGTIYGTRNLPAIKTLTERPSLQAKTTAKMPPKAPSPTPITTHLKPLCVTSAAARSSCSATRMRNRSIKAPTLGSRSIRGTPGSNAPSLRGTRNTLLSPVTPWRSRSWSGPAQVQSSDRRLEHLRNNALRHWLSRNADDNSDNSLLGTLGNGINNYLLDTPQYLAGPLKINTNGRNGRPAFNTALFPIEAYGTLGNAKRRVFYGPGIENFDLTLQKNVRLPRASLLSSGLRHSTPSTIPSSTGPRRWTGRWTTPNFGNIVSAASPRLVQLVAKFSLHSAFRADSCGHCSARIVRDSASLVQRKLEDRPITGGAVRQCRSVESTVHALHQGWPRNGALAMVGVEVVQIGEDAT
jgi:hypothetical protein